MPEVYRILADSFSLRLSPCLRAVPPALLSRAFQPDVAEGYAITRRFGDPDLLECVIWRKPDSPVSYFVPFDENGPLMILFSETPQEYMLALGKFGRLCADARLGADIFENLEDSDD